MKFVLAAIAAFSVQAFASSGCYDVAITAPESAEEGGIEILGRTGYTLCTSENFVKEVDELVSTGKFIFELKRNGRAVKTYRAYARSSEGAVGTTFTRYTLNLKDLEDEYAPYALFRMRNQKGARGDYAGRVSFFNTEYVLIHR